MTVYDDPTVKQEVELAQWWEQMQAWAAAFADWFQETINAWYEAFRPVIAKLNFWQNFTANRVAAERRRRRGFKSSMVQLNILKSRFDIIRQQKSPGGDGA